MPSRAREQMSMFGREDATLRVRTGAALDRAVHEMRDGLFNVSAGWVVLPCVVSP